MPLGFECLSHHEHNEFNHMSTAESAITAYINSFPEPVKGKLLELRNIIRAAVPEAEECISYGMPALKWQKVLVYYAGWKSHIGFYPTAEPMRVFASELIPFKTSKGAVQFPLDAPLPEGLITRMILFRKEAVLHAKRK
jgi:uncharacterized protein YdhG (YjbR/CyaY superfamily)